MRHSMRLSLLALAALLLAALSTNTAQAGGSHRHHASGHGAHGKVVVIDRDRRHGRHGWGKRHRSHRQVVVVHRHRPATRVIVRHAPPRHHHADPLSGLLGRVLVGAVSQVLESGRSGQTVAWVNPDTRARATVTPVRTYQNATGQYCREYTTTGRIGGYDESLYGTACRMPDGSWLRVNR